MIDFTDALVFDSIRGLMARIGHAPSSTLHADGALPAPENRVSISGSPTMPLQRGKCQHAGSIEFFLVPYLGACIHTPPPPPNQIVHVRIEQGFIPDGGLYTPVWVDGPIRNERNKSGLSYVDGSSDIPSSYSIDAIDVQRYE